jgi:hypothetical protein
MDDQKEYRLSSLMAINLEQALGTNLTNHLVKTLDSMKIQMWGKLMEHLR